MLAKLKLIAPLLFLISCIVETSTNTVYVVKNKTMHEVTLTLYDVNYGDSLPQVSESTVHIAVNNVFSQMYGDDTGSQLYRYPFGESTDSVIIIFDGSRKLIHRRNELNSYRNILNRENYVERVSEDNNLTTYTYTYILTEEDYNSAVPLEK
ncbi:hypothetical protein SAMN05444280_12036 [Tangfeifania diversioriginum]|uniref:Uncharacterized protein n=1 Tax=Tangfeifania diversioriginum TaxID=1168035 RepID=A0A1M6JI50_9BACT|nr:hypothetical protein [Tangfeifania diversioriginum]SHJ46418.1 hypothetical protein SAMN05444280_12036 [Tangfeifania diversioriginum]